MSSPAHDTSDSPAELDAPRARALGKRVAGGFVWLLAKTGGIKVVTIVKQIVLAWLLIPEDFGLVALAYSVTVFVTHIKSGGLREVLVQKDQRYDELANAGFWLSAIMSLALAMVLLALGPIASWTFGEPRLTGLIYVLALGTFITGPISVLTAKFQIDMRFRAIATVGIGLSLVHTALAIVLALLGFGPYSFVIPMPIVGAMRVAIYWYLTRPPVTWRPEFRKWPELLGAGGLLTAASFFAAVNQQGANFILGLFHAASVVGIFFFAFNLSQQIHTVLMNNLSYVLLPSFSKLQHEPERQVRAFLRACSMLAVVGIPSAFLIAATADPFIRMAFADRWLPAIGVLQALAVGMALNINSVTAISLIKAQGRFGFVLWLTIVRAAAFVLFVTIGAMLGGALAVSVAVAVYFVFYGPSVMYAAIRPSGRGWRDVVQVHAMPFLVAILAAVVAVGCSELVPTIVARDLLRLLVVLGVFTLIYVPMIRCTAPELWAELAKQIKPLLSRIAGRVSSTSKRVAPVSGSTVGVGASFNPAEATQSTSIDESAEVDDPLWDGVADDPRDLR